MGTSGGRPVAAIFVLYSQLCVFASYTVELQWLEHLWDYESMLETGVVRASEC